VYRIDSRWVRLDEMSHLVGSVPFTMSTMHGHMNITSTLECLSSLQALGLHLLLEDDDLCHCNSN
jgi:hypothetical protein